jgi:hypothetical protein
MQHRPWTWLSILTVIATIVVIITHERLLGLMPACEWYRRTGFLCPGCGGRRCVTLLLQGRWLEAMRMNALVIVTGIGLFYLLVRGTWHEHGKSARAFVMSTRCGLIVVGSILGFWLLRNLPFFPFTWLAPVEA